MNIGQAAKQSGVNAKLIRHYESIGLIPKASRSSAGYRIYSSVEIHHLKFVRAARSLGFSMKEIKKLIGLWRNRSRTSAEVKKLALAHIAELDNKISELETMSNALKQLASACKGDQRPNCPILDELASEKKIS